MPVSAMKFVTIKAPATTYKLLCFKLGGAEDFFKSKGFGSYGYVAGILLGPNSSLFIDTLFGRGDYGVERAGFVNAGDLYAAWEYILRFFDKIPERSVLVLEQSADDEFGWIVTSVEAEKEVIA